MKVMRAGCADEVRQTVFNSWLSKRHRHLEDGGGELRATFLRSVSENKSDEKAKMKLVRSV